MRVPTTLGWHKSAVPHTFICDGALDFNSDASEYKMKALMVYFPRFISFQTPLFGREWQDSIGKMQKKGGEAFIVQFRRQNLLFQLPGDRAPPGYQGLLVKTEQEQWRVNPGSGDAKTKQVPR